MDASGLLRSMRLGNCVISAIGVFAGYTIAERSLTVLGAPLLLGMGAAFLITGAGNSVNDFFDADVDSRLGRQKAGGPALLVFSLALFALGVSLAGSVNQSALAIAAGVSALLLAYACLMHNLKFAGNFVVALGTALTLVFGAAVAGSYAGIGAVAAAAFFANVGREVTKDLEDVEGDEGVKRTLPMMFGFGTVTMVIFGAYFVAIAVGAAVYFAGFFTGLIYVPLFAASCVLFAHAFRLVREKRFSESQRFSKYGMVAALAAFLGGVL